MTGRGRDPLRAALRGAVIGGVVIGLGSGCALQQRKEERRIPQYGVIDVGQPRELDKVTLPPYMIEPPDELEVTVRPTALDPGERIVTVQADGLVDLGFGGEVYVAGMTLAQAEQAIARSLAARSASRKDEGPPDEPIEVSVRLSNATRSKVYYVLGTVTNQGPFPFDGGETVLTAILEAGLRPNSVPEKAYLVRPQRPGHPDVVLRIDWEGIKTRGDTTTNYQLFPGDRVVVPGTRDRGLIGTLFGG